MDKIATAAEADQTFTELVSLLSAIHPGKFNAVPFDNSWTAGQLARHLVLSAGGFVQLLNGPVTDTNRDPEENIPMLKAVFLDFSTKLQSPDFIVPEEKEYDKELLTKELADIKTGLVAATKNNDLTKTYTAFELPGSGYLTGAEAVTFTLVHTQRHIHQLKNIKTHLDAVPA